MRTAIATALLLAGCSRFHSPEGEGPTDAQVVSADAALPAVDAAAALPVEELPPATYVGARRAHLAKLDDEPGLAKNAAVIRAHFDGGVPAAMDLQAVSLGSGRQALILGIGAIEPNPIALLVDAEGSALWIKDHPLGGMLRPARPYAIAPRPDGGVALFVFDEPAKLMAGRMWAADGAAFAEIVLFELSRCDAISAAWWPGRGWVVVAAFPGGARAQLLGENGSPVWGPKGMPVGEAWRAPAPATIVIEPETSSWLLFQHATRGGTDHVVSLRYGPLGERLQGTPVDLGPAPGLSRPSDRVEASLVGNVARVTPPSRAPRTP